MLPFTFRLNGPVPAVALAGKSDAATGAASAVEDGATERGKELEDTGPFDTVMLAVPATAVSEVGMTAVRYAGLPAGCT